MHGLQQKLFEGSFPLQTFFKIVQFSHNLVLTYTFVFAINIFYKFLNSPKLWKSPQLATQRKIAAFLLVSRYVV